MPKSKTKDTKSKHHFHWTSYQRDDQNWSELKKELRTAAREGNIQAFFDLGDYYQYTAHKSEYAKLFYSLVIKKKLNTMASESENCKTQKEFKRMINDQYFL